MSEEKADMPDINIAGKKPFLCTVTKTDIDKLENDSFAIRGGGLYFTELPMFIEAVNDILRQELSDKALDNILDIFENKIMFEQNILSLLVLDVNCITTMAVKNYLIPGNKYMYLQLIFQISKSGVVKVFINIGGVHGSQNDLPINEIDKNDLPISAINYQLNFTITCKEE